MINSHVNTLIYVFVLRKGKENLLKSRFLRKSPIYFCTRTPVTLTSSWSNQFARLCACLHVKFEENRQYQKAVKMSI